MRDPGLRKLRRAVGGIAVAATVTAGCSAANEATSSDVEHREAPSVPAAEGALVAVGRPASATFDLGSFDFGVPVEGVGSHEEGRLA